MDKIRNLTLRETEIIDLKCKGYVDKQIAKRLGISYSTVRNHIDKAKLKLACSNTAQLAIVLNNAGLLTGDSMNA
nr:MAG TPA: response regulator [Caudoviricetes sp.]